ncbi:MAG: fused MFS/spermidine synthase [Bacillota bacterium]|nr:fused MFS/spermidine synthase [Bacillota bacterium]
MNRRPGAGANLLRVLVFVCGACLMGLEMLGSRVLAPTLGNSIFVWGSLISSFMIALSAGYWLGGFLADAWGSLQSLGVIVTLSGITVTITPSFAQAVLDWSSSLGPRAGPLAASVAIFFVPALLLGMVSPFAMRIAFAGRAEGVGRTSGGLYALSTAGSILGTLLTAFWLIPLFGVIHLITGTGVLLTALGLFAVVGGWSGHRAGAGTGAGFRSRSYLAAVLLVLIAACAAVAGSALIRARARAPEVAAGPGVIFQKESQYHRISVVDTATARFLKFDNSYQTGIDKADPYRSYFPYADYFHLALAFKPDIQRVLFVGLGGGIAPKRMWRDYPGISIDVAEIDPVVLDVARKYFGLPDDPRLKVTVQDGRRFVASTGARYDLVVMDAYYADAIPFHLTTEECFREVKKKLQPGGLVAYNIIGVLEGERSKLFRSMYRTISGTWAKTAVFGINYGLTKNAASLRNIIVFASDSLPPMETVAQRVRDRVNGRVTLPGLEKCFADLYAATIPTSDVNVLTDDFAPVDTLLHIR